ncbi:hypothetical protein PRZ48_001351 [Zasmidium cellare]|uniref:DUF3074 domain-containing protein n=1 Tax=Zasmidium cellare TaxID=395010 RepID=A0ABR0F117_ZASCE|nr:hypothetical protein PRZ48_001351 [Zasmidium cellare]
MAELHEALTHLGPVDWDDVPKDNLPEYLGECFSAGELICNSVPQLPNGTPFGDSKPHLHIPNVAKSHKDIHPSTVRSQPPHKEHESLQKNWGKAMKFNKRDNPLDIHVYKMAGHDRHGAWFARKSVHEGLGFDKFKRAMLREFSETMTVSGGPGAGAVRGLAADRRIERIDVKGVGKLEVYQLSAQFPGPVTPRDFLIMTMGTDSALTEKSAAELEGGKKHVPRHFMLVSKPVTHPDAPIRSGYVRGHYESVEMIREIPLSTAKSKSTSNLLSKTAEEHHGRERGHTVGFAESRGLDAKGEHVDVPSHGGQGSDEVPDDPELNPVEWIMITRSDPGGGIPRFLVERGTPETMLQDVHKFFNWACSQDHIPDPDEDLEKQEEAAHEGEETQRQTEDSIPGSVPNGDAQQDRSQQGPPRAATEPMAPGQQSQGGILNNLTKAIEAGLDSYAPAVVANVVQPYLHTGQEPELSDDSSDTSSIDSFLSAEEMRRLSTAPEQPEHQVMSTDNLSLASGDVSEASKDRKLNDHEKEVQKIMKKREKLNEQLAKKRIAEEQKLKQAQEKDETDASKQKEEIEKRLKKTEEKHRKELEKLEQKKAKEMKKAEEKRRKKDDATKLSLVTRERDDFRSQSDLYRRENTLLREQVADLQAQNTVLAQRLGKLGGQEALKGIEEEFGHKRTRSMKSMASAASSESAQRSTPKTSDVGASSTS